MKNSVIIKFIAVFLCAAALLGVAASGMCMFLLGAAGLMGTKSFQDFREETTENRCSYLTEQLASNWASSQLGGIPDYVLSEQTGDMISNFYNSDKVHYSITDSTGKEVYSNYQNQAVERQYQRNLSVVSYQKLLVPTPAEPAIASEAARASTDEAAPEALTEARSGNVEPAEDAFELPDGFESEDKEYEPFEGYSAGFFSYRTNSWYRYNYTMETTGPYTVKIYLEPGAELQDGAMDIVQVIDQYKRQIPIVLAVSALLFAIFAVYLCISAGRKPGSEEVKPSGLNAMPMDLYAVLVIGYLAFCIVLADELGRPVIEQGILPTMYSVMALGFVGCLIFVGFCFAFAAQLKAGRQYWLKNTLAWRFLRTCWLCLRKVIHFIPVFLGFCWKVLKNLFVVLSWLFSLANQVVKKLWNSTGKIVRWISRRGEQIFSRLPLTWQWLSGGFFMILILGFTLRDDAWFIGVGCCIALVLYGAGAFGTLLEAAQKMRQGDLEEKVDDRYLVGSFKDFAFELNGLADVAMVAAQKQLKSERMKTELITNVSHDIKTPLTSIINYVDLLEKPHTPEEEKAYLEVLKRQSGRMKKLIEDLIEMNKASTGSIPVEIIPLDAVETVNQVMGEFSDKLDAAGLTPVFHKERDNLIMLADGRLVWRAMSNVLSNAVKYALPGTRLYVDVEEMEGKIVISIKNISRAPLNVSADELMERFVRGDTSRNTEGSGLGLNIAQSLMTLQKGQLHLLVDGDLFKVTLVFPKAPQQAFDNEA